MLLQSGYWHDILRKYFASNNDAGIHNVKHYRFDILLAFDVWFAFGLMATIDALFVVIGLNRQLISRFHYAVSLRMMFLAVLTSLAMSWRHLGPSLLQHGIIMSVSCLALYLGFGRILNVSEKPRRFLKARYSPGTASQYIDKLNLSDASWLRSLLLAALMVGGSLMLNVIVPPFCSMILPILVLSFEVRSKK